MNSDISDLTVFPPSCGAIQKIVKNPETENPFSSTISTYTKSENISEEMLHISEFIESFIESDEESNSDVTTTFHARTNNISLEENNGNSIIQMNTLELTEEGQENGTSQLRQHLQAENNENKNTFECSSVLNSKESKEVQKLEYSENKTFSKEESIVSYCEDSDISILSSENEINTDFSVHHRDLLNSLSSLNNNDFQEKSSTAYQEEELTTKFVSKKFHRMLNVKKKIFECSVCSFKTAVCSWLRIHMKKHNKSLENVKLLNNSNHKNFSVSSKIRGNLEKASFFARKNENTKSNINKSDFLGHSLNKEISKYFDCSTTFSSKMLCDINNTKHTAAKHWKTQISNRKKKSNRFLRKELRVKLFDVKKTKNKFYKNSIKFFKKKSNLIDHSIESSPEAEGYSNTTEGFSFITSEDESVNKIDESHHKTNQVPSKYTRSTKSKEILNSKALASNSSSNINSDKTKIIENSDNHLKHNEDFDIMNIFCDDENKDTEFFGFVSSDKICDQKKNQYNSLFIKDKLSVSCNSTDSSEIKKSTSLNKEFSCSNCNYKSKRKTNLIKHMRTHSDNLYKCTNCSSRFSLHKLKEHEIECKIIKVTNGSMDSILHSNLNKICKVFTCSLCNYKSRWRYNVKKHIKKIHLKDNSPKDKKCKLNKCSLEEQKMEHHNLKDSKEVSISPSSSSKFDIMKECVNKLPLNSSPIVSNSVKNKKISDSENYEKGNASQAFKNKNKGNNESKNRVEMDEPYQEIKKFHCSICGYLNNNLYFMKQHVLTHTDLRFFKCKYCDFKSNSKISIRNHYLRYHISIIIKESTEKGDGIESFLSKLCKIDMEIYNNSSLYRTIIINRGIKNNKFTNEEKSVNYQRICDQKEKTASTEFANRSCTEESDIIDISLKKEKVKVMSNETFKCNNCEFKARSSSVLKRHSCRADCSNTHQNNNPYSPSESKSKNYLLIKCQHCEYTSVSERDLKRHNCNPKLDSKKVQNFSKIIPLLESDEIFECDHCEFKVRSASVLKRHICRGDSDAHVKGLNISESIEETELGLKLRCHHCEFNAASEDALKKHSCEPKLNKKVCNSSKINTKLELEEPFKCVFCDCTIRSKSLLKRHICRAKSINHTYPRNSLKILPQEIFRCSNCAFTARSESVLQRHYCQLKSNKKQENKFSSKNNLKSESNEAAKCEHCEFRSKSGRILKRHSCEGKFIVELVQKNISLEIQNLNQEEMFKCKHCKFIAKSSDIVKKHKCESNSFKCKYCDFTTNKMILLMEHSGTIHTVNDSLPSTNTLYADINGKKTSWLPIPLNFLKGENVSELKKHYLKEISKDLCTNEVQVEKLQNLFSEAEEELKQLFSNEQNKSIIFNKSNLAQNSNDNSKTKTMTSLLDEETNNCLTNGNSQSRTSTNDLCTQGENSELFNCPFCSYNTYKHFNLKLHISNLHLKKSEQTQKAKENKLLKNKHIYEKKFKENERNSILICKCGYSTKLQLNYNFHLKNECQVKNKSLKEVECDLVLNQTRVLNSKEGKSRVKVEGKEKSNPSEQNKNKNNTELLKFKGNQTNTGKRREGKNIHKLMCIRRKFAFNQEDFKVVNNEASVQKSFKCTRCDFKSFFQKSMTRHMKAHFINDDPLMKCSRCTFKTSNKNMYDRHSLRCNKQQALKSNFTAKSKTPLLKGKTPELKTILPENDCKDIKKSKTTLNKKQKILNTKNRERKGKSPDPRNSSKEDKKLKIKRIALRKNKVGALLLSKSALRVSLNPNARLYDCLTCNYKTIFRSALAYHISSRNHQGNLHHCNLCKFKAHFKAKLIRHKNLMHKKNKIVLHCSSCDFITVWKAALYKHVKCKH